MRVDSASGSGAGQSGWKQLPSSGAAKVPRYFKIAAARVAHGMRANLPQYCDIAAIGAATTAENASVFRPRLRAAAESTGEADVPWFHGIAAGAAAAGTVDATCVHLQTSAGRMNAEDTA